MERDTETERDRNGVRARNAETTCLCSVREERDEGQARSALLGAGRNVAELSVAI